MGEPVLQNMSLRLVDCFEHKVDVGGDVAFVLRRELDAEEDTRPWPSALTASLGSLAL
jgi:hypothetical protein